VKKVLIVGASSVLGSNLAIYLRQHYRVYGTFNTFHPRIDGVPMLPLKLESKTPLEHFLSLLSPDAIVYCAARIDNAECEQDPFGTLFINAECPAWMARWVTSRGGRFIFLSSSKVFSGNQGDYTEEDAPDPTGHYGSSKRQAEEWLSNIESTFVLRLGTLFGLGSYGQTRAMFNRVLDQILSRETTRFIDDEKRSFFCAHEISKAVGICIDSEIRNSGTFHLSTDEKYSYYGFAKLVATVFGAPSGQLVPVSGHGFSSAAADSAGPRGNDLSLLGASFRETFSVDFPSVEASLLRWRNKIKTGAQ
jgi:dTDP-4-dehydrorhamnose reductase